MDGLRGYLALWVAVFHALSSAAYTSGPAVFGLLFKGGEAVTVFIILSGFVITHLLMTSREGYWPYITRRFFRIYPIYLLCCVLAILVDPAPRPHFWAHVIAHLTLLHGLIPDNILPRAAFSILAPAWSLSLEWQFYLVAPFVIGMVRRTWALVVLALGCLGLAMAFRNGWLGDFPTHTNLAGASGFFAIGIGSRLGLDRLRQLRFSAVAAAAVAVFAAYFVGLQPIPLGIWGAFMAFLLWGGSSRVGSVFSFAFTNRPMAAIGAASYSLYLVHLPLEGAAVTLARMAWPAIPRVGLLGVSFTALGLSVLAALVLYRWVERPGMALGRKLSGAGWDRQGPAP
jgi:peptidoglycan/LPS O-acetylase OafA/YrhL